jgi:hypothetical protein
MKLHLRESIATAIFALAGVAFVNAALFGDSRNDVPSALWLLGCGVSAFALAISPHSLFERVTIERQRIHLPRATGLASILNVTSVACMVLAGVAWLLT